MTMSPRGRSFQRVAGSRAPGARQWPAPHEYTAKRVGDCGRTRSSVTSRPLHRAHRGRHERSPAVIRPMAKTAIERYAEGKGHPTITEAVMDEARAALGM